LYTSTGYKTDGLLTFVAGGNITFVDGSLITYSRRSHHQHLGGHPQLDMIFVNNSVQPGNGLNFFSGMSSAIQAGTPVLVNGTWCPQVQRFH